MSDPRGHRSVAFAPCSLHTPTTEGGRGRWHGNCEYCVANGLGHLADAMDRMQDTIVMHGVRMQAAIERLTGQMAEARERIHQLEEES